LPETDSAGLVRVGCDCHCLSKALLIILLIGLILQF